MATSAITNSLSSLYSTTAATTGSTTKTGSSTATASKELDKDAFLQLLVSQLKNQDPLNPMKDTEFISQLATFSSLEQMTTMNTNMTSLVEQQYYSNNAAMLGKTITTSDGKTGVVDKVTKDSGSMYLYVGSNKYSLSDVVSITSGS
jgi:flagellar basal-body rod modification protein FlgD